MSPSGFKRGRNARGLRSLILVAFGMCLALGGCASREARSIEAVQAHDEMMSCAQLRAEFSAADRMLIAYRTDETQQSERNQLAVMGALFNPLILMHADAGDAGAKEQSAYRARRARLVDLMQAKGCDK